MVDAAKEVERKSIKIEEIFVKRKDSYDESVSFSNCEEGCFGNKIVLC